VATAPFLVRFGGIVGASTLAALLAAAPGALRLHMTASTVELGIIRAWLTLAGLLVLPMVVLVPVVRLARDGLRGVVQSDGAGTLERVAAAAVFACTWLWFLSAFGAALREKTHQRALGAVTFAVLALVSMIVLAMIAVRLSRILHALRRRTPLMGTLMASAVVLLSLGLLGLRIARAAPALSLGARATLVDGLAFVLALSFGARRALWPRVGPPVAASIFIVAMHTLASSAIMPILEQTCPFYYALLHAL
jgi:hypothetical protein